MPMFEVTHRQRNGDDATDYLVFWVLATDIRSVQSALEGTGASVTTLHLEVDHCIDSIDFILPRERAGLCATLLEGTNNRFEFANMAQSGASSERRVAPGALMELPYKPTNVLHRNGSQYTKEVHALIRAAQSACQSRNGSNPQATARQHALDLDALESALGAINTPDTDPATRRDLAGALTEDQMLHMLADKLGYKVEKL